jgi:hypothetical protein
VVSQDACVRTALWSFTFLPFVNGSSNPALNRCLLLRELHPSAHAPQSFCAWVSSITLNVSFGLANVAGGRGIISQIAASACATEGLPAGVAVSGSVSFVTPGVQNELLHSCEAQDVLCCDIGQ